MQYVAPTLSPLSPDNACPSYNRLTFDRISNSCSKVAVIKQDDDASKVYTNKACKWTKGGSTIYADSLKEMAGKIGKTANAISKALCGNKRVGGGIIELIKKEGR